MWMDDPGLLTVGQVIKRTGLSRKALRLYEQADLVVPVTRTAAGYRLYDVHALPRLDLIRRARTLDVGIAELGELLDIAEGSSERTHDDLSALVTQKLVQTEQRMAELLALEQLLRNVARRLRRRAPTDERRTHGCGSLLCTCPVDAPTSEGGEDMNPIEIDEKSETSSPPCECGCDCCTPKGSESDTEADKGTKKATTGCDCGCGN